MRLFRVPRCRVRMVAKVAAVGLITWSLYNLVMDLYNSFQSSTKSPSRASLTSPPTADHIYRRRKRESTTTSVDAGAGKSQSGIPRIIHQTWKSVDSIPETFRPWMESWIRLNPDWEYWFWTDDDIRTFISATYPDYLWLYDSYPSHGYRVDMFRYFVLYEFGGVYVDLDMECLRPLSDYPAISRPPPDDCIIAQEPLEHALFLAPHGVPLVSNALMACRSGHAFFAHVISGLQRHSTKDVLRATGPYMLTVAFRNYLSPPTSWTLRWLRLGSDGTIRPPIRLAAADDFQPSPDDSMVDYMRSVCIETLHEGVVRSWLKRLAGLAGTAEDATLRRRVCDRLSGYDFGRSRSDAAYATHHWTHSWVGRRNDPWGLLNDLMKRFSIEELFDDRLRVRDRQTIAAVKLPLDGVK